MSQQAQAELAVSEIQDQEIKTASQIYYTIEQITQNTNYQNADYLKDTFIQDIINAKYAQASESVLQEIENNMRCLLGYTAYAYQNKKFFIYPALAYTNVIAKNTPSLVDVVRQGILVKTDEENVFVYIGGCSTYWRSANFIVFQGWATVGQTEETYGLPRTVTGGVKWYKAAYEQYYSSLNKINQICVIPLLAKPRLYPSWINPPYYQPANNYEESIELIKTSGTGVEILSYQPDINVLSLTHKENFKFEKGGSTYISEGISRSLQDLSVRFPYPYIGFLTPASTYAQEFGLPTQIFLGIIQLVTINPRYNILGKLAGIVYPEYYNAYSGGPYYVNSAMIGSPIYLARFDPNTQNYCSKYGMIGLVSGVSDTRIEVFKNGIYVGYFVLYALSLPKDFSMSSIIEYAKALGQESPFNFLLGKIRTAKKAIAELISAGILSGIAFSAVMAVEEGESVEQIVQDSKVYVEKLNKVYNNVVNRVTSCIEGMPGISKKAKVMYIQRVIKYLNGIMASVDANMSENEIEEYLKTRLSYDPEINLGIPC